MTANRIERRRARTEIAVTLCIVLGIALVNALLG